MKIVYFGNNPRGVVCLERLIDNSENIVAVVAHPEKKTSDYHGRSVHDIAAGNGIPCRRPEKVNSIENIDWLKAFAPDLFVLSGYNQILRSGVLEIPEMGTINLHGGKLPQYRGVAPINWQIINGETTGACSVIFVDEGIDTGDIITQKEYDIALDDTAETIVDKTLVIFPNLLVDAIDLIKTKTLTPIRQDDAQGCYYTRRYPRDGQIFWRDMTAFQVHNLIRALVAPYPGAFTYRGGDKVTVWKASLLEQKVVGVPGRVVMRKKDGVVITAMDRGLLVEIVQPDNGEVVPARDYFTKLGEDLC